MEEKKEEPKAAAELKPLVQPTKPAILSKPQEPLNIEKEIAAIQDMYTAKEENKRVTFLIYGDTGTGKTRSLITAPGRVLLDSFDPEGTKTIKNYIATKEFPDRKIIADTRWETEDPFNPAVYLKWAAEYDRRKKTGFFNHFRGGTYALDSGTTWTSAIMGRELKRAGRTGGPPQQNDYLPVMQITENIIKDMAANLPCTLIFICHEDVSKDEATGKMRIAPLLIGKSQMRIPLLFSEIYAAQSKETAKGTEYSFLTRNTGMYKARTRIGAEGLFDMYEKPDFTYLLKKAGYKVEEE